MVMGWNWGMEWNGRKWRRGDLNSRPFRLQRNANSQTVLLLRIFLIEPAEFESSVFWFKARYPCPTRRWLYVFPRERCPD